MEIKKEYTPGPWRFEPFEGYDPGSFGVKGFIKSDNGLIYSGPGSFNSLRGNSKKEATANAKLIAAAPELAEALLNIENDDNSIPPAILELRNKALQKAGILEPETCPNGCVAEGDSAYCSCQWSNRRYYKG